VHGVGARLTAKPCRETAGVLTRRAVEDGLLPGRSIEADVDRVSVPAAR